MALLALESNKPIYVMIDSPGGEVYAGLKFIDAIRALRERDVQVVCYAKHASSMALSIFSECSRRVTTKDSKLLWHAVRAMVESVSLDEAKQLVDELSKLEELVWTTTRVKLGVSESVWKQHYDRETLHTGEELEKLSPDFTDLVDSVSGYDFPEYVDPMQLLIEQLFGPKQ